MESSQFPPMTPTILVIGGRSNILGSSLLQQLKSTLGYKLVSLDLKSTQLESEIAGIKSFVMDLNDDDMLKSVVNGCGVVVHVLEAGDNAGIDADENKKRVWDVNMGLTSRIVQACLAANVRALLFASSSSVINGPGSFIQNANETSLGYYPIQQHHDEYAKSKTIAEAIILAWNQRLNASGNSFITCALRSSLIYGTEKSLPSTQHFFRDFVKSKDAGTVINTVHLDNLVGAYTTAIDKFVEWIEAEKVPLDSAFESESPVDEEELKVNNPLTNNVESELGGKTLFIHDGVDVHLSHREWHSIPHSRLHHLTKHFRRPHHGHQTFAIDYAKSKLGYSPKEVSMQDRMESIRGLFHDFLEHEKEREQARKNLEKNGKQGNKGGGLWSFRRPPGAHSNSDSNYSGSGDDQQHQLLVVRKYPHTLSSPFRTMAVIILISTVVVVISMYVREWIPL